MSIFLTSDTHFGHKNIATLFNRPFTSVEEMNETLIENWNKTISDKDDIYHLGDFGWGNIRGMEPIFHRLKGRKHLIQGNHDHAVTKLPWKSQETLWELKINKKSYILCHFPMRSWNKSFHGSKHFHGHSHGTLSPHGWSCDVGVDCWNYTPVSLDQLDDFVLTLPRGGVGKPMPRGTIWNAERHIKYGFEDFFIGDGSSDHVDPDEGNVEEY